MERLVDKELTGWGHSRAVVSTVTSQSFILGPALLASVNDVDIGIRCTLSRFADNAKLSDTVNTLEGRDAIRRDWDKLER